MKARNRHRIYPNPLQRRMLARTFGCVRVVFNDVLRLRQESYQTTGTTTSITELQKQLITQAKHTRERWWLAEVSNIALQQSIQDACLAFRNFFQSLKGKRKGQKVGFPRFKRKSNAQAFRLTRGGFSIRDNGKLYLAKIGDIKVRWSRKLPSEPSSVTVIQDAAGRYFVSFVCDVEQIEHEAPNEGVGIDLGIATFATLSMGEKVENPRILQRQLKRLRRLQQSLSRKVKGSKRYQIARRKVARLRARIKDTRTDFLHKLSTKIISENQAIVLEDLNVSGMVRNRRLARAISDVGWRQFRAMLEAKSIRYGRDFHIISRWEPTSQRCSSCGKLGGKQSLDVRVWMCLYCGAEHDRDLNAAVNIKQAAGGHSEALNACVEQRRNARGGLHQSDSSAAADEARTRLEVEQFSLFTC
ncbi:MAG: IS200/IS605 family element transposase accessory protein TnpB [Coleofasciculaceae cyanobacterium RL_1_1]|nr:IS200/IS605 family element transposase accessory protein TnpB [Coleofasciculaceae cyanobacterium RL_1_1]